MKKNTSNVRRLVDESFVPSVQRTNWRLSDFQTFKMLLDDGKLPPDPSIQEKWTDHHLNLLRCENVRTEKILLGMIETSFDNIVNSTIPAAIFLQSKFFKIVTRGSCILEYLVTEGKVDRSPLEPFAMGKFQVRRIPLGLIKTYL